jgi:hypothetical protein
MRGEARPMATATPGCSLARLNKAIGESRMARVRTRFAVAVLMCNQHRVCRSSTLAHKFELLLHASLSASSSSVAAPASSDDSSSLAASDSADDTLEFRQEQSAIGRARLRDIELLRLLGVTYICDLMVCARAPTAQHVHLTHTHARTHTYLHDIGRR